MTGWQDWRAHPRAYRSAHVDWEVALFDRLGRLDDMTMIPLPPPLVGNGAAGAPGAPGAAEVFPVPSEVANPDPAPGLGSDGVTAADDASRLPRVEADRARSTVIVGVIDIDIGFGHRRFRRADGRTRVLAAWQQGAPWRAGTRRALPFGEELFAGEIDALMAAHGAAGPGAVEHDGFYERLGLISHTRLDGMGGLAGGVAHGTHVLGLAAGQDPTDDPDGFADNVRLLVVNLPPSVFFGEGGAFLDYYLSYGLQWIRATHRAIVAAHRAAGLIDADMPLLVNMSFGKQAGAPDGRGVPGPLDAAGAAAPGSADTAPILLVPAGNDNLERCHALFELGADEQALAWRVQPDDETSNFLEIWGLVAYPPGADGGVPDAPVPFEIDLDLPDAAPAGPGTPAHGPAHGSVRDLAGGLGRIYCDWVASAAGRSYRLRYLVCLAPDGLMVPGDPAVRGAPAGQYRLRLRNTSGRARFAVRARIQTDEATLPAARNARRAYFEDPAYVRFEPDGRLADTFPYSPGASPGASPDAGDEGYDGASPIRRHGTTNSYAARDGVVAIAGFRLSDGRPAPYSATGLGARHGHWGRAAPTAAFPSDDGAAHFGVLGDGPRDGSVVAMRGTSFACAAATRLVAQAILAARLAGREPDLPEALAGARAVRGWPSPRVDAAKAGWGRVPYLPPRPVDRM